MSSRRSRSLALGVTGFIVAVSFSGCGQSTGTDTADDPATSGTSASATSSPTESATPAPPAGLDQEAWLKPALAATRSGLPAFVPAEQPEGYAVTAASFDKAAKAWTMEFTDGTGATVTLFEVQGSADDLVADRLGADAAAGEDVDLSAYGTGTWSSWSAGDQSALTLQVKKTAVLLTGPSTEGLTAVAQTLLTADTATPDSDAE